MLGREHPASVESLCGLASCLQAQGRYADASEHYSAALQGLRELLGEAHYEQHATYLRCLSDMAKCACNLVSTQQGTGRASGVGKGKQGVY